jgi:hypothetical protein
MPAKRKIDTFDPNKSDSNDTDFDPTEARASVKKSRKSSSKRSSSGRKTKRARYRGSDVEDDVEDSLLEESFSDEPEEEDEEVEMNEKTGRAIRKAAKKAINYEEESDESDILRLWEISTKATLDEPTPKRRRQGKQSRATPEEVDDDSDVKPKRSKIVKLKVNTPQTTRATRGASARLRGSTEPTSAGLPGRRSTRAHTEEGDEPVALSNSGHHIIRPGHSPEPIGRARATRGSKGVKQPASTIKEEIYESSSNEQHGEDIPMATEIAWNG